VKLRQSLNELLNGNRRLSLWKATFDGSVSVPNGCHLEISHLGAVRIRKPIVDIVMQIHNEDWATADWISLLSYAKVGESGNHFVAGLRYPPSKIDRDQAVVIARLIEFGLRNVSPKMTIQEAFDAMIRQKSK
jgi:hypothetical protein